MIRTPTVLILGAGASAPYGFPTARELMFEVIDSIGDTNKELDPFLRQQNDDDTVDEFKRALRLSGSESIDAFLEKRPEFVNIGKAAIVHTLVPYEDRVRIKRDYEFQWYEYLYGEMDVGVKAEDFPKNMISIITFNYDRSLEYFLWMSLTHTYGLKSDEALQLLQEIPILHVYGQLGDLDPKAEDHHKYSGKITDRSIEIGINGINLYTEDPGLSREWEQAHHLVENAEKICFLGFGYHKANVERLRINELFEGQIMGTTLGFEANEKTRRVEKLFNPASTAKSEKPSFANEEIRTFLRRRPVFDD